MSDKVNYLRNIHLSLLSFLIGFVLFDINKFSHLFFDTNNLEASVLLLLLVASSTVFHFYWWAKNLGVFITGLFIVSVASLNLIKDSVLLYPGLLELIKYGLAIISGLCVATVLKTLKSKPIRLNLLIIIFSALVGTAFAIQFIGQWLIIFILLDLIILFLVSDFRINRNSVIGFSTLFLSVLTVSYFGRPSEFFSSQKRYSDRVVFSSETPFQKIDITTWKGHYWAYANNIIQFSTLDEQMYYEPIVHPVMQLASNASNVLVIGGENGIIIRELKKYPEVKHIDLIPLDTGLLSLSKTHPIFKRVNKDALEFDIISLPDVDAFRYLENQRNKFDVIIIDAPDPIDLEINRYYTKEFYELCFRALTSGGLMVTQAGSPYYATKAFEAISNTVKTAGFTPFQFHNQVLSMGEWGWIIGSKSLTNEELTDKFMAMKFDDIDTKWINNEAMQMMMSFGKSYLISDSIKINALKKPIIHEYYMSGTWNFD